MPKFSTSKNGNTLSSLDWVQEKLDITWKPCFVAIQIWECPIYTIHVYVFNIPHVQQFLTFPVKDTKSVTRTEAAVVDLRSLTAGWAGNNQVAVVAGWMEAQGSINSDLPSKHITKIEILMGYQWCLWWVTMRYKTLYIYNYYITWYNQLDMIVGCV